MLPNVRRSTVRTALRQRALDALVRCQRSRRGLRLLQRTAQTLTRLHVNLLALVVPVRGLVDDVELWKAERVSLESVGVLAL